MSFDLIIVVICYILGAIYASYETALIGSDPLTIYARIQNPKQLKKIMNLFQNKSQYINALLVGLNVMNISVTVFTLSIMKRYFPLATAGTIATIVTIFGLLILNEVFPKFIGFHYSQFVIIRFYYFVEATRLITLPFVYFLNLITRITFPVLSKNEKNAPLSRNAVEQLFRNSQEDFASQQLVEMIDNILNLDHITITECKNPIHHVTAFPSSMTVEEFRKEVRFSYYTRIPIYHHDVFHLTGYVLSHEVISKGEDHQTLSHYEREALFFPENVTIDKIFDAMNAGDYSMVFAVNEFGAVSGILTNKDLNEMVIGNFQDERRNAYSQLPSVQMANGWIVSGRQDIDYLNQKMGLGITKKGFETMAGFTMERLSRIPREGDTFEYNHFRYTITEMQGRFYVHRVTIEDLHPPEEESSSPFH